ncbi:hypothetical protein [Acetobacter orleanensis]|uniref:Uncharacterized protein n=1 Tax=Acetobacter orleanensis TaxID=104099 RepID=A0A4Y3TJM5_9PROT|nr:hypothetical protein AD949_13295 [Acetobacter orleanensis]PCD80742.1 hypothetical protein CO710_02015 [Acetobacter orleanensis]GAN68152.1 hypothetical protein Abol_014_203 [Acetobacter orleanensis JCM 7639]GEB81924.1 hypothetical protein AOR01nite_04010 [Acetobacter orleanensis]
MRRMTKLLLALPLIAGTTLTTLPAAEAHPGGWGRPGWGGPGWGGPPPPRGYWGGGPRRYWHRGPGGGAIAGALIGGLAVGALAGAALGGGGPPIAYAPPPPPPPPPMGYAVPVMPVVPVAPVAPGYYAPGGYYSGW